MQRLRTAVLLLLIAAPAAWGQSVFNQTSGSWHTSGNWSPSGVPGSGTTVHVGTTGTNRTANISTAAASSLNGYIGVNIGNVGTINVTGQTWNNSGLMYVGYSGNGTLNVQSGGVVTAGSGVIGYQSGSTGAATVTGSGSQWNNSSILSVGDLGTATLTIQNGGVVSNTAAYLGYYYNGGSGTVTVTGAGSQWNNSITVEVGRNGTGILNIQNGGSVSNTAAFLGAGSGSTGTATVTGAGSLWTHSSVHSIGNDGTGTLTVSDGGKVTTPFVRMAWATGTATLNLNGTSGSRGVLETAAIGEGTGTGGTINFNGGILRATGNQADFLQNFEAGDVQIQSGGAFFDTNGYNVTVNSTAQFGGTGGITKQGTGTLTLSGLRNYNGTNVVETGTLVNNSTSYIGNGATGSMTVTGVGSQWNDIPIVYVGYSNSGTLNIQSGGMMSNSGYCTIGHASGVTGIVTVTGSGSQWNDSGDLYVGNSGNGTLNIQSGGVVSNTFGYIGLSSGSTGTATVTSSGSQWTSSGTLIVGYSGNGTLTVDSGGKSTASNVTLASSGTGSTGTLNLNGTSGSRGVLETSYLSEGSGTGGGTINFNGGILRATENQANFLQNFEAGDVQIQSGGAFFDTNGYDVGISMALQGNGNLTKQGTGTLTLTGSNTYGGGTEVKSGTLEVATGGSINHSGAGLWVGDTAGDNGSLTISGGSVTANGSRIGHHAGAVGAATVSSGTWSSSGQLFVGYDGNGTLDITGGTVSDGHGVVGYAYSNPGAIGTATVSGGTWSNSMGVIVGTRGGTGTLNLTGSGIVTAGSSGVLIADQAGSTGTLNIGTGGTAGTLNAATVTGGSGTATVNFNHTGSHTFNPQMTGSLAVNKLGSGTTVLTATHTYTGATMVLQGKVLVDGSIAASSSVDVSSGASLGGHGAVSTITGAGTVGPGNSPGVLTATAIDPSGGMDFLFEMTQTGSPFYDQAAASGNDVLHLTGATPFTSALTAANSITVDFSGYGALSNGLVFRGGFYADNGGDFYSYLQNASFNYLGLGAGESVLLSTVLDSANFAGGSASGYITQFTIVVPEPSRALLLVMGLAAGILRRRRKVRYAGTSIPFNTQLLKRIVPAILALLLIPERSAWADSIFNVTSGNWNTAGNWTPSGVPGSGTFVVIGTTGTNRTATISTANALSEGANIGNDVGQIGTVNVNTGRTWTNDTNAIVVGALGTGTLSISGAGKVTSNAGTAIGYGSVSTGTVTVTGAGSQLTNTGGSAILLGNSGTGTLTVSAGGLVTGAWVDMANNGNGKGTLNLNGTSGSRGVLETGYLSEGTGSQGATINFDGGILRATDNQSSFLQSFEAGNVQILGGGAFIDSNGYNIGISTALQGSGNLTKQGAGTLTLTGASSYSGNTSVDGGGMLQISSGGSISDTHAYIGDHSDGNAIVTGSGSQWNNSGQIVVGYSSAAELTIQSAGVVNAGSSVVGYQSGSTGAATVTGASSQWSAGSYLSVGDLGTGTVNVQSGGSLTSGSAYLGYYSGGSGTVTVNGSNSTWTNSGTIEVGRGGSGTLNVQAGGNVSNTIGYLGTQSGSTGVATVTGSGSQWNNSSLLSIGNDGTGTLTVADAGKVTASAVRMAWAAGTATLNLNGTSGSRGVLETAAIGEGTGTGGTINFNGGILRATANSADFLQNFETGDVQIQSGGAFFDTNGYDVTVTNSLHFQGITSITKQGTGTLTLAGTRYYDGNHLVEEGTLANASGALGVGGNNPGTMTVTGSGSQWNNDGTLIVGNSGFGTLNVQSGGKVSNTSGYIAQSTGGGTAAITGSGSEWNNSGSLYVGYVSSGTLSLNSDGKVTASNVMLANSGLAQGTLNLNGTSGSRGVLETSYLSEGSGTGGGTINFNGGILRATGNQSNFLQNFESGDVQIQNGGVILDTQSYSVGIGTALQGSGGVTKEGTGDLTLSGTSTYTGATMVLQGKVLVDGSIASSSSVDVSSGASLGGHGAVSTITGAGLIGPGNSPGILTATAIDPSGGMDFLFEMTQTGSPFYDQAAASGNDVLRLTGATPFTSSLTAANSITVDFSGYGALSNGLVFRGGFYADNGGDFYSYLQNASFNYLGLGAGESVLLSTVLDSANFATGSSNGYITQFTIVVPEPGRALLMMMGSCGLLLRRKRRA